MSDDERYEKHYPMVTEMLRRKAVQYAGDNGHAYYPVVDHEMWLPTEEDVPSLMESIKFWRSVMPPGDAETWSDIQTKTYLEAKKKEMICYSLLGKVPDMWDVCFKQMKEKNSQIKLTKARERRDRRRRKGRRSHGSHPSS